MKNKGVLIAVLLVALVAIIVGIIAIAIHMTDTPKNETSSADVSQSQGQYLPPAETPATWSDFDVNTAWDESATTIHCNGKDAEIKGIGVKQTGEVLMIHEEGTYVFSGKFEGQIDVVVYKEEKVHLVFNGFEVTCEKKSPVLCERADKLLITLADGTKNTVIDTGSGYIEGITPSEGRFAGAIHSKDALTINGGGTLEVQTTYRHGIVSNSNLRIVSGVISVKSVDEGFKGKETLSIRGGTIAIDSVGDGLKVSDNTEEGTGFLAMEGGDVSIKTEADGLDVIDYIRIVGGTLKVESKDHAFTTEGSVSVGGKAQIVLDAYSGSEDSDAKGIKAEKEVLIEGGNLQILRSYEGIESKTSSVTFAGGNTSVKATNDGVNASTLIEVKDGLLFISAIGDGMDGGDIVIGGGSTVIQGSVYNDCAPMDTPSEKKIVVTGGVLLAYGSVGAVQYPSHDSTQAVIGTEAMLEQGKSYTLRDAQGNAVCSFQALGDAQTVCFSSDKLGKGGAYTLFADVTPSGVHVHGIYKNPETSGGESVLTAKAQ